MKKFVFIFFLWMIFSGHLLHAQSTIKIDSLQKALEIEIVDSASVVRYIIYAMRTLRSNNTEARLVILDWVIAKSKEKKYDKLEANGYHWKAITYHAIGQLDKAMEWYTKTLEYSQRIGYANMENNANIGIAAFYLSNNQYDKALLYYDRVIEVSKRNNFTQALATVYSNKATTIFRMNEHLPNPKHDDCIVFYKLAIETAEKVGDTAVLIGANLAIGDTYNLIKEYSLSESYFKKVEHYITIPNWEYKAASYYANVANSYIAQKKYTESIQNSEKALTVIKKYPNPDLEYQIYQTLSEAYKETKDYAGAYLFHVKYSTLHDSLLTKEKFAASAELEIKYNQAIKDKEIARLNADQKIKQLELEKQKSIIVGNLFEAERKEDEIRLLSQDKELQDLLLSQQEEVLVKNLLQAKSDSQQIQLGKQGALLQEKEISNQKRTRNYLIAGLGLLSLLAFILYRNITAKKKAYIQLQHKSEQIKEQALLLSKQAKQIAQFQSQMNPHFVYNALHNIQGLVLTDEKQKANRQIQSLAHLMRKTFANADKDDISLEEEIHYLNKYVEFEKTSFGNNLNFEVTVSKDAEGAQIPPMMIQPFIENAIKHAELNKVENPHIKVLIEIENNLLTINIIDNGTGIKKDITETDKLSHSLTVIKSRLDLLFKGRADVNNQPVFLVKTMPEIREGTNIKFYLPLNYAY